MFLQVRSWHPFSGTVIMIDYLKKGSKINGVYYANELQQLKRKIKDKLRKDVCLHTAKVARSQCSTGLQVKDRFSQTLPILGI